MSLATSGWETSELSPIFPEKVHILESLLKEGLLLDIFKTNGIVLTMLLTPNPYPKINVISIVAVCSVAGHQNGSWVWVTAYTGTSWLNDYGWS